MIVRRFSKWEIAKVEFIRFVPEATEEAIGKLSPTLFFVLTTQFSGFIGITQNEAKSCYEDANSFRPFKCVIRINFCARAEPIHF